MAKSFSSLAKSYDSFSVPQYVISVAGKDLKVKEFPVLSINVSQTVGKASSAQISFACPFAIEKGKFEDNIYDKLKGGEKIEIKLGYAAGKLSKPETVFVGLIGAVRTEFSPGGVIVSVTCYDVRMVLFYNQQWRSFGGKKMKEVINEVLKPCKDYCKIEVAENKYDAVMDEKQAKWVQDNMDDYKFILRLAMVTNSTFYVKGDTLYFVDNIAENPSSTVKLKWGEGLMSFSSEIDWSGQIGSVEISYRSSERKTTEVPVKGNEIKGDGNHSSKDTNFVEKKSKEVTETMIGNDDQAKLYGKALLMENAMKYVTAQGSTIGLPDIQAGDAIEIDGVGKKLEGKYFLTQVTHRFDAGGFLTNFTCQRAKI